MPTVTKEKTSEVIRDGARISGKYREFLFIPKRAYFEKEALEYPLGKQIFNFLKDRGSEIKLTGSHNRITGIPGDTPYQAFMESKKTLVVGIRKTMDFQTCKPSAHFQLPLVTSCPGACEYCYLNTTLGKKPYIRIYVNIDEILAKTQEYIASGQPEITVFEGAATSDPLPVEPLTGALAKTISFFGEQQYGRFRFVTKFNNVDSLLTVRHEGHTRIRFSINAASVIRNYEHRTPGLAQRLDAALKTFEAGYPTGFIIGPIITFDQWQREYGEMFDQVAKRFGPTDKISLELISHRFTPKAKNNILGVFPETTLPMEETDRKYKYGQFGYGKYVYTPEQMGHIKTFMHDLINQRLPEANIEYFI